MKTPACNIPRLRALATALLVAALVVPGCSDPFQPQSGGGLPRGTIEITREGETLAEFDVELALTPQDQATGLMNRPSMPVDEGMVFIFANPIRATFIMKNTLIPLDIAFWDQSNRIVNIQTMAPCTGDPCDVYDPGQEVVGALEVNAGSLESAGVSPGDLVTLREL